MHSASQHRRPHTRKAAALLLPLTLAASLALAVAPAHAADPVSGPQTAGDALFPNVGNGGYDVKHYDIDLAWTTGSTVSPTLSDATIEATTTIQATAEYALSDFSFDFEGLEIDSVTVNGQDATWTRDIDAAEIKYKLVVTPAEPVEGDFTTVVTYHGTPGYHLDADDSWEGWVPTTNGSIFMGQPIGSMTGYPNNNTPGDKATYTISLNVPATITSATGTGSAAAVSNGELVSIIPSADGTRKTWVWNQTKPMATELALITIGKYEMVQSTITLSDGSTIPEYSFYDSDLSTANKTTALTARGKLQTIIQGLESIFGPYPGKSTGIVIDTVPGGVSYALETQDRSFFPSANSANGNTLIHELAHQWYGNNVSPKDWNDIWINEGMASWAPTYYNNAIVGTNPGAVETTYFNSWNNTSAASGNWSIPPAGMTDTATLYNYQTYTRGAQFWAALRTRIGDEAFFDVVLQWQSRYAAQSAGRVEFQALAEELSGQDLDDLFQDWIYEAGKPAWPARAELSLATAADPTSVDPGGAVSYTITVENTGRVPVTDATVTLDLADVIGDVTLTSPLPDGLTLTGTTATWVVPSVATSSSESITLGATILPEAEWATLNASVATTTPGLWCTTDCSVEVSVSGIPDVAASTPTIFGSAAVAGVLTAQPGAWQAGATLAYQWFADGEAIMGATGTTLELSPADLGSRISVAVTGSLAGYRTVTRTSAATSPVGVGPDVESSVPTVSGTAAVGEVLAVSAGDWQLGASLTYQWFADGQPIAGATDSAYPLTAADFGKTFAVAVTGSLAGYRSVTRMSDESSAVASGPEVSSAIPAVSGRAVVGGRLTVAAGTWQAGTALAYQWLRGGRPIAGATAATYSLTASDLGQAISVSVTGALTGYTSVTKVSAPTAKVAPASLGAITVKVTGKVKAGKKLTAKVSGQGSGATVTYAWRSAKKTGKKSTFKLTKKLVGKKVTLTVTVSKPGYQTVTKTITTKKVKKK